MTLSRRALVAGLLLAPLGPRAGAAQSRRAPRVGLLETGSLAARAPLWDAVTPAVRELDHVEGSWS